MCCSSGAVNVVDNHEVKGNYTGTSYAVGPTQTADKAIRVKKTALPEGKYVTFITNQYIDIDNQSNIKGRICCISPMSELKYDKINKIKDLIANGRIACFIVARDKKILFLTEVQLAIFKDLNVNEIAIKEGGTIAYLDGNIFTVPFHQNPEKSAKEYQKLVADLDTKK